MAYLVWLEIAEEPIAAMAPYYAPLHLKLLPLQCAPLAGRSLPVRRYAAGAPGGHDSGSLCHGSNTGQSHCQVSCVRCHKSCVRCHMSGIWCQVADARCWTSEVICQMSDVRGQVSGAGLRKVSSSARSRMAISESLQSKTYVA